MFKSLLAKLAAMSLLSKTIVVAAAAVIVVGSVAIGLTTQNPSVDPDDQQNGPQQEQQLGDVTPDDGNGDGSGSGDSNGSDDVVVEDDKKDSDKKDDDKKKAETEGILGNIFVKKYTVKFETNGGGELEKVRVLPGTAISSFDTPYFAEHIFLGWYYDEALTEPVESDDKVTENLTLYASYLQQQPLETLETVNFASAEDVGTGFAISVVSADTSMTAEEVLAAITADDLTDPDAKDVITVSGSNGNFTVKGNGGFHEGGSYRITLNRDELTFKDQPESAREFNFTVHRDEVMNLTMQSDIKYIPVSQFSNIVNNGDTVATLDLALYQTDGNSVSVSELSTGTFTYSGTLAVGDKVCIYEGAIPTARDKNTPKDQLGDMAYLTITGKDENTYTYESAEAEDVLFMPDVLPMPTDADTDSDAATITVENKYLDYSDDFYSYMNLDSQTTVDVGDFLAFYTGDLTVATTSVNAAELTGYGKVTDIAVNGDTTTITYIEVTWAEVEACMDVYAEESLSGAELLEGVDTEQMESEIEQQAYDSGFAEEAATYLASLALATENFTALSDNMNLEDYKVTLTDGTPVSPETLQLMAGGGIGVEIDGISVKARVSTKPTHLGNIAGTAADEKGLAISLEVTVVFTIGSEDSDGQLEITVTGSFVEEVGVDFGVSADAVWDWAFIIPYISDIRVSANVDTMNYTGVSFNAAMITKENEGDVEDPVGDAMDMANEIKDLLEYMTDNGDNGDEMQDQLVERYSEMLNAESDWIRVVEYNIVEVKKSVPFGIPLINISFSVDFVIDMDAAISVGFDFQYIEGKRHVFTVSVKDRDVYADTIDLKEKTYQFCFYSMGRIGMKAGIEMDFSISVISASLGSVGFEAGAGAYTNLYGYFFYELKYTESQGKSQKYSGALLVDMGIYLEAGLKAQALGGRYSAEMKFLDKEWPMYEAGRRDNVLDFATEQEDMPELVLKQYVRRFQIPNSVFNMDYLDLRTGEQKNSVYDDRRDFSITMTNEKFTYDPDKNTIIVNADEEDVKLEGEMIITWKRNPMSFSSKPLQRTISLYWDNLRSGYMIVPYTNGGSYVPMIIKEYEQQVKEPANPEKMGYTFAGWYSDEGLTTTYTFPELMPAKDTNIYAKWEPKDDTPYTVEHYQENFLSGSFDLVESETFTGTTDSSVTPATKSYTGFVSPVAEELVIEPDGSATLCYYYALERHTVTFDSGMIDGADITAEEDITYTLKYGARIPVPQMAVKGYTFAGWSTDSVAQVTIAEVVGTEDLVYTAMWTKNPDTAYRVEYYVQQSDGRYTLQHMYKAEAFTGSTLAVSDLRAMKPDGINSADQLYIEEDVISFKNMTVNGNECTNATVDGSGKTIIKVNYARSEYTLTFDLGYENKKIEIKDFVDAEVTLPENPTRTGYTFLGWSKDGTTIVTPAAIIGDENVSYKALWKANKYTVKFDANNGTGEMADMVFTYDVAQNLAENAFTRVHYDFAGWTNGALSHIDKESVTNLAAENGAVVTLAAKWTPKDYTVTYHNVEAGEHTNLAGFTVESDDIILSDPAARVGYTFAGWYTNEACTGTAVTKIVTAEGINRTLYAKWAPNTDTAYTVEHYQQQLDGSYLLVNTDNLKGTTDSTVTPATKSYIGFTAPATQNATIKANGSLVVKYEYTRNPYTITFKAAGGAFEDGSTETTLTFLYGETITLPKLQERLGYGFNSWCYSNGAIFSDATMGAENLILTAHWTAGEIGYTVNHYLQNVDGTDSTVPAKTVSGTAKMDSTVTPALESFVGFTAPNSTTTLTITATAANNVVNYNYTRNQYDLSWNLNGGSASGQAYTSGKVYFDAPITAPVPVKEGYRLSWDKTVVTNMPAEKLTYTANWTANEYTVLLNANGGSGTMSAMSFDYGTAQNLPTNGFTRTGYTFAGWATSADGAVVYTDGASVNKLTAEHNGIVTLYAVWTANTYAVKFDANGGSGTMTDLSLTYDAAAKALTANSFTRTGYTFNGWAMEKNGAVVYADKAEIHNLSAENGAVITLYADWKLDTYTITYVDAKPHSNPATYTVVNDTITLVDPENRFGYTFGGWYDNEACTGTAVTEITKGSTGNKTLYAKWTLIEYKIEYELNGGTNNTANVGSYTIKNSQIDLADPSRVGYTFTGWYTNADLTTKVEDGIFAISEYTALKFYAGWEENTYSVFLDPNDESGTQTAKYYNLPYTGDWTATIPTRSGYLFLGWAFTPDGEKVCDGVATLSDFVNISHENHAEITLYGLWEKNEYTITYIDPTATKPTTAVYTYSVTDRYNLKTPTKGSAYKFGGWYEDADYSGEMVSELAPGTRGNKTFYAKWEHAGTFSIAYTRNDGDKAVFTVTRTLPKGTVGTELVQTVYVRTQNGTAYANTTEGGTGSDKFHFIHNTAALEFYSDDTSAEFKVTEKDDYLADYIPASYQIGGVARKYYAQIYKIDSLQGGLKGTISTSGSIATRTMPVSKYVLTDSIYNTKKPWVPLNFVGTNSNAKTISGGSIAYTESISMLDVFRQVYGQEMLDYVQAIDGKGDSITYVYNIVYDVKDVTTTHLFIEPTITAKHWDKSSGESEYTAKQTTTSTSEDQDDGYYEYIPALLMGSVKDGTGKFYDASFYASFQGNNDPRMRATITDVVAEVTLQWDAPKILYIAPVALSDYKAGEYVYLTVVYNEPLSEVSNVKPLTFEYQKSSFNSKIYDSNLKEYFVSGSTQIISADPGTNAVVFRAMVKNDLTVDEVQNELNVILTLNNDDGFKKNIGEVRVTAKDLYGSLYGKSSNYSNNY